MHSVATRLALSGAILLTATTADAARPPPVATAPQHLAKRPGEADDAFAARVLKLKDTDVHTLAASWNGARTLFVDFERGGDTDSPERPLIALEETAPGAFRKLLVTVGETEGGAPELEAFGFANADRDPAKELIVIFAWRQNHYGACGPVYEVRIIDNPDPAGTTLRQLPISKHFGMGCVEKPQRYRFTTIDAVKRKLSQLGY
jgi:hypothetical protein